MLFLLTKEIAVSIVDNALVNQLSINGANGALPRQGSRVRFLVFIEYILLKRPDSIVQVYSASDTVRLTQCVSGFLRYSVSVLYSCTLMGTPKPLQPNTTIQHSKNPKVILCMNLS